MEYRQLYSECSMLFFGDNGQGDLMCAEQLTRMNVGGEGTGGGGMVSAAFIHQVADPAEQLSIYLYRTYVGAAIHVYNLGFISQEGLFRVCTEAVQDMVRLRIRYLGCAEARPWREVVNEMNEDVDRANELLRDSGFQVGKVPNSAGVSLEPVKPKKEPALPKSPEPLEKIETSMEEGREERPELPREEHSDALQLKSQSRRLRQCFMRRKNSAERTTRLSHCPSLGEFSFATALPAALGRCARLVTSVPMGHLEEEVLETSWREFLWSLDEEQLDRAERCGLSTPVSGSMPSTLRLLIKELAWLEEMLLPGSAAGGAGGMPVPGMKQSKAQQVAGCLKVIQQHFDRTRVLLGSGSAVEFRCCDLDAAALSGVVQEGDLVVGLHPCGSLGDNTIEALAALARENMRPGLLLVSCCLQGRAWAPVHDPRPPVSCLGQALNLSLPRVALQRSNLWRSGGRRGRGRLPTRLALRRLLELRGRRFATASPESPSLRGLGHGSWREQAQRAMEREGLAPPSRAEVLASERWAEQEVPRWRRLGPLGKEYEGMSRKESK
eukprot:g31333.t1